jgi:hypothetical protein
MPLVSLVGFFLICSGLVACATPPKGPVCIVDVKGQALQCSDYNASHDYTLPLSQGDGYLAFPPDYGFALFEYCKGK